MGSNIRPRGGPVADYNEADWERVKFSIRPTGWRGRLPVLWRGTRRLPFLVGSHHGFNVTMTIDEDWLKGQTLVVSPYGRRHGGHRETLGQEVRLTSSATIPLQTPWMDDQGQYVLGANLTVEASGRKARAEDRSLVTMDLKSSDTVILLILGIALSVMLAALSGWVVSQLDEPFTLPSPLVVVQATPILEAEPQPASQSETDNNEP